MDPIFVLEQCLNGLGYGLMLFLLAAGLTLVFGIMDVFNLAHGTLFMLGGYVAANVHVRTGSFTGAVLAAIVVTTLVALRARSFAGSMCATIWRRCLPPSA
jgi:branched-chain amino acid transport system permease protein